MLPQSHFIALKKTNIFSNALRHFAFTLSAAYVNQSLKNWTRSTSYMCARVVNLLRVSESPNYKPARQIWPREPFQPALENILSLIKKNILRNICWFDRMLHIPKELRCMIWSTFKTVVQYVMWPLDEKVWRPCLKAKLSLGFDWTYVVGH